MSPLLELIRTSTPAERAEALVELSRCALADANGPVAIVDEDARTLGYLSAESNATGTSPIRELTPERSAELRHRAEHPEESIPADEFIRLLEADLSAIPER